jgi:hypothetical protein
MKRLEKTRRTSSVKNRLKQIRFEDVQMKKQLELREFAFNYHSKIRKEASRNVS